MLADDVLKHGADGGVISSASGRQTSLGNVPQDRLHVLPHYLKCRGDMTEWTVAMHPAHSPIQAGSSGSFVPGTR